MKRYFNFYHYLMIIPALVLYTNCDGYQSTSQDLNSLSSCTHSASLSLKLLNFDAELDCENVDLIKCERRSFHPNLQTDTTVREECVENAPQGSICLTLTERSYNTGGASDNPADYAPGAAYNFEEVNCYLSRFSHDQKPIFQSSTGNLKQSLIALHKSCLGGGAQ